MFTSIISERAMLEKILADHRDIKQTRGFDKADDVMADGGYVATGYYTTSQLRRYILLEMFLLDRIAAIDKELAEFEANAPATPLTYTEEEFVTDDGPIDLRIYDNVWRSGSSIGVM